MKKSLTEKLFDFSMLTAAKAANRKIRPMCSVILAAGGHSVRMGQNKLTMELAGKPVIQYSLEALEACANVDEVIVVCARELIPFVNALSVSVPFSKIKAVVEGGQTRMESVANGLKAVSQKTKLIAIHDAARPLADSGFIDAVISAAKGKPGVIPVVPVKDTIKIVADGKVVSTPARDTLFCAQTPQVFDADIYRGAVSACAGRGDITDDSMMLESIGAPVETVDGKLYNIKLTTAEDIPTVLAYLENK